MCAVMGWVDVSKATLSTAASQNYTSGTVGYHQYIDSLLFVSARGKIDLKRSPSNLLGSSGHSPAVLSL